MNIFHSNPKPRQEFIPAKPSAWFTRVVQEVIKAELTLKDKLHLQKKDVDILEKLPTGSGIILASNHADEADPRVCLELSRQSRKSFITMCNREAFDELQGLSGWALQRLGYFSVKRGARDTAAKDYAIEVVRGGKEVLVVFPEGEIFYQNEKLQHFHSGAIDICFKAMAENRKTNPSWTAFIVPMVIKYTYSRSIETELNMRISGMEKNLSIPVSTDSSTASLQQRLLTVAAKLIERKQIEHELTHPDSDKQEVGDQQSGELQDSGDHQDLSMKIKLAQNAIYTKVEGRHSQNPSSEGPSLISKSWKLGAELRQKVKELRDRTSIEEVQRDLAALQEVEHLAAWSPRYLREASSNDRLAESVIKLERETYKIKRPKPISGRDVLVRVSDPIDMAQFVASYEEDARAACSQVTHHLHQQLQTMLDELTQRAKPASTSGSTYDDRSSN